MRQLSLRARLVLAVLAVAAVNIMATAVVISVTSDQLLDQIDERLVAIVEDATTPAGDVEDIVASGDVYYGLYSSGATLTSVNEVLNRGELLPAPIVDPATIDAAMRPAGDCRGPTGRPRVPTRGSRIS